MSSQTPEVSSVTSSAGAAVDAATGIVDEDVEATEFSDGASIAARQPPGPSTSIARGTSRRPRAASSATTPPAAGHADRGDIGARLRKLEGDLTAETASGTRDDGHLPGEIEAAGPVRHLSGRRRARPGRRPARPESASGRRGMCTSPGSTSTSPSSS